MVDILIIAGYLLVVFLIGIVRVGNLKNVKDFAIGPRNLSLGIVVVLITATRIGGGSLIALSAEVYKDGIFFLTLKFATLINIIIYIKYIFPKLDNLHTISPGGIVGKYIGSSGQIVLGITGALVCIGRISVQLICIGAILEYFFKIPVYWSLLITGGILVIYASYGGIRSVIATDIIQVSFILISIPILYNISLNFLGGYETIIQQIPEKFHFNYNVVFFASLFFMYVFPTLEVNTLHLYTIVNDSAIFKKAYIISAILDFAFTGMAAICGVFAYKLNPNLSPNLALPFLVDTALPYGLKGIVIAGLLAACMSTADAYLNTFSLLMIEDIIKPISRWVRAIKKLDFLRIIKIISLIGGASAIFFSSYKGSLFEFMQFTTGFWTKIVAGPLLSLVLLRNISIRSYFIASFIGLFTSIILNKISEYYALFFSTNFITLLISFISCLLMNIKKIHSYTVRNPFSKSVFKIKKIFLKAMGAIDEALLNRFNEKSIPYNFFVTFVVCYYFLPYFLWENKFAIISTDIIVLRFISGILCISLLFQDNWPLVLKRSSHIYVFL